MGSKRIKCLIEVDGTPLCEIGEVSDKIRHRALAQCKHDSKAAAQRFIEKKLDGISLLEGREVKIREDRTGEGRCPGCARAFKESHERQEREYDLDRPGRPAYDGSFTLRKWLTWIVGAAQEGSFRFSRATPATKLRGRFHRTIRETPLAEITPEMLREFTAEVDALSEQTLREIPADLIVEAGGHEDDGTDSPRTYVVESVQRLLSSISETRDRIQRAIDVFNQSERLHPPVHVDVRVRRGVGDEDDVRMAHIVWCPEPDKDRRGNENWNRPTVEVPLAWNPYEDDNEADLIREVREILDRELFTVDGVEIRVHVPSRYGYGNEVGRLTTGIE